jgi:putative membrane protein
MKTLLGLLAAAAAGVALAQGGNPDQTFFDKLAQGGMAEVQAGQLAESKATRPDVKDFAGMMVKDHGKANEKLKALAAKKSVKLPADAGAEHKAALKKLEGSSGDAFDKAYIQNQLDGHEMTVELLKYEIDSGADSDAKAFASEVLPTVKSHLEKITKIAKDTGVRK